MECPRQLDPRLMGDCPIDRTRHMEDDRVLHREEGQAILLQRGRLVQGVRHPDRMTVPILITVARRCL